jgi:ABC-2 type transport system ATP-binding protein
MAAEGQLSDLLAQRVRGWEVVVTHPSQAAVDALRGAGTVERILPLGGDRYMVSLPAGTAPEPLLSTLMAQGGQVVSLNPVRDTLEDLFVRKVAEMPTARGLEASQP